MSKSEKSPAFQFYPKDVLSDGNAMAMPADAFGIYMKLLCFDWIDDGLIDDDKTLMRLGGYDWHDYQGNDREIGDYEVILTYIRPQFEQHPTKKGYITNPRLQKERQNQQDRKKSASDNANKRWNKNSDAVASIPHINGICEPDTKSCSSSSSSSSSSNNINKEGLQLTGSFNTPEIKKWVKNWRQKLKAINRNYSQIDLEAHCNIFNTPEKYLEALIYSCGLSKSVNLYSPPEKEIAKVQAQKHTTASESMHPALRAEREREAKAALENLGMGGLTK